MSGPTTFFNPVPIQSEPKRKGRFIVQFPSDFKIQEWSVLTSSRPKLTIGETEIPVINTKQYVAGNYNWETIDITFLDSIQAPNFVQQPASIRVIDWIAKCVKGLKEPVGGIGMYAMGYAVEYMIPIRIYMLDPYGAPVELWTLFNCFVTSFDGGDLDKASDDLADFTITVRYAPARIEVFTPTFSGPPAGVPLG